MSLRKDALASPTYHGMTVGESVDVGLSVA